MWQRGGKIPSLRFTTCENSSHYKRHSFFWPKVFKKGNQGRKLLPRAPHRQKRVASGDPSAFGDREQECALILLGTVPREDLKPWPLPWGLRVGFFHGFQDNPEEWMAESELLLFPSSMRDGFGPNAGDQGWDPGPCLGYRACKGTGRRKRSLVTPGTWENGDRGSRISFQGE